MTSATPTVAETPRSTPPNKRRRKLFNLSEGGGAPLLVAPTLILLAVVIGYPVIKAVFMSFQKDPGLDKATGLFVSGGFAGFSTRIALDTDNDIGVVALTNTNDPAAGLLTLGIFETIYKFVDEKNRYGAGARIPDQERYEGAYRNRWGDVVVVGIDTNLVALDPRATSPVKTGALLKARGKDSFVMEPRSNTDSPGELARFLFDSKRKKAREVVWGSTPLERLDE